MALMAKSNLRGPPEGHISTAEAARRTGYTTEKILNLAKAGRLLSRLVVGRWFIDELSLKAFVANRKRRPKRGRPASGRQG